MKSFAILGEEAKSFPFVQYLGRVSIGEADINIGVMEHEQPEFDEGAPDNANMVLVKVRAMSCNYRDKSIMLLHAQQVKENPRIPFSFIGSEFSGTVVAMGKNVSNFRINDDVIPNASYPDPPAKGVLPGIVSNHTGAGWLKIHESKLIKKPEEMTHVEATCFCLGAQTAMSMVRRSNLRPGESSLIMSARSVTSQFLYDAVTNISPDVFLSTTDPTQIANIDINRLIRPKYSEEHFFLHSYETGLPVEFDKFDVIFDPFFDLHIDRIMHYLKAGGRYITCGLQGQHPEFVDKDRSSSTNSSFNNTLYFAIMRNLTIIGNCIGTSEDLRNGLKLFEDGLFRPKIDAIYPPEDALRFVEHTFLDKNKNGKVVMSLD